MFKIKDPYIFSPEAHKLERPGIGRLRVTHKDHAGKFNRSFMITIFLSILYMAWFHQFDGVLHFFLHWSFAVYGIVLLSLIIYIWLPGYVEFDNVHEQIKIKRYQYKLFSAKVIPYADVKGIQLNFNQNQTQSDHVYLLYYFKLKLKDGSLQPIFSLSNKKKARKIKTWIDDHVNFDFEMKRKRIKLREPIFKFNKKG